jgi:hypothetical protein
MLDKTSCIEHSVFGIVPSFDETSASFNCAVCGVDFMVLRQELVELGGLAFRVAMMEQDA